MRNVVVLNASYEPLGMVSVNRAVLFLLRERAELVAAVPGAHIRSADTELPLPRVVRLVKYVRVPYAHSPMPWSKRGVLERDAALGCVYCGRKATTVEHIVPVSRGGGSDWMNTAGACKPCNGSKGARLVSEAGLTMRYQPRLVTKQESLILAIAKAGYDLSDLGFAV